MRKNAKGSSKPAPSPWSVEGSAEFPLDDKEHTANELENPAPPPGKGLPPLVGLGGSAGSSGALQEFFAAMPTDSGMAFVVVLHLSPDHVSTLAEMFQRSTSMPVVTATDGVKVEANCVYVIPLGKVALEATKAQRHETIKQSEASTEELESSREELNSINEELSAVNLELTSKVDELGQANSDLQSLMSATDIATVFLDRELRIMRFTPSAKELFNFIPTDLGRPLADLSRKLDYPEIVADAEQALARLTPTEREVSAGERCFIARTLPYRTADDYIAGVVLTFLDITARKESEEELRQGEARKDAVLRSALDAIVTIDQEGNFVEFNPAAERIFGYSRAEAIGRPMAELIIPARLRERHHQGLAHYLATGEGPVLNRQIELPALRADGTEFPAELAIIPVPGSEPPLFTAFLRDISERKRAEEALQESEERFRAAVATVSSLIWTNNAEGMMTGEQPGWGNFTGQTEQEYQGHGWSQAVHPDDAQPTIAAWERAVAGKKLFEFEHRVRRRDGEWRLCSIRAVPLLGSDGVVREWVGVHTDITEQRRQAEALKESELRFRHIADAAPVLIWISDTSKKCIWFNKTWLDFTGRTMQAESGDGWAEGVHPDDLERCVAIYHSSFDARQPFEMEYRLRHRDGSYRWLLDNGVPRFDGGGEFLGYIGSCVDISAHKTAQATALASHRQLENVLGSITDGLAMLDKEWRYTYFSEQAARIIGIPREDLLGGCVWDLFPAAQGTKFYEGYHRAVATGQKVEFEEYYPEPINKWLECHCYPSDEGLSVYFHDVTARKEAEATLRQNEALFSTLIEQAPMGVYVVDARFRMQQVNSLAEPVFSTVRPLIGRDFTEVMETLWGPEVGGKVASNFRHTLDTGERFVSPPFVNPRVDLGVEQAYDWETQRVTLPDGTHGVVCYFADVTEQRRAETALLAAKEAAEAANQSKDHFLAVLSHELRTPLTPVLMVAGALEHDPDLRPDVREDLAMIKRNVELETKLIDDLLDLSRITSGKVELKIEPVDLNEAVQQVCGMCRSQLEEQGVHLETDLSPEAGLITADRARLQQVLWNVLKNAVKFTAAQGIVRVITSRLSPDCCEVRVQDNGIGISPEMLPRIFDAFEQGDAQVTQRFGGLGLGLAISRALIEMQGGAIRAESAGLGQGATFVVEVAGRASALTAPAQPPLTTTDDKEATARVLMVEDHADTARLLCSLLRAEGYSVLAASDVAGAIAVIEREPIDVLITDLGLPDGSGYEIIRAARKNGQIVGIAMSGYGMEEDIRRSRAEGFAEHLTKPLDFGRLMAAIKQAVARR